MDELTHCTCGGAYTVTNIMNGKRYFCQRCGDIYTVIPTTQRREYWNGVRFCLITNTKNKK